MPVTGGLSCLESRPHQRGIQAACHFKSGLPRRAQGRDRVGYNFPCLHAFAHPIRRSLRHSNTSRRRPTPDGSTSSTRPAGWFSSASSCACSTSCSRTPTSFAPPTPTSASDGKSAASPTPWPTDTASASPFGGDTGPSAWTAPVYPWIVSLAFRVFGSYTHAASFALLTFNSLCSALTSWVDLPHRAPRVQRKGRRLVRMDLGAAALHHLLVRALDLGDQPHRPALQPRLHAHRRDGGRRPPHIMDRLRRALGRHRPHQSVDAFVPALRRMLARLPTLFAARSRSCSRPSSAPFSSG